MKRLATCLAGLFWIGLGLAQGTPVAGADALRQHLADDEKRLADWPQLARYRDENVALPAPKRDETRVVFMGDSITDFWGHDEPFFPGKPYVNRGISGQTTAQMLVRFRPDVIALQPRVVVILAGTNDIAGNAGPATLGMIEDNLTSMAELARANHIKVVLASVTPINGYVHAEMTTGRPPTKILALNAWIKAYAQREHLVYLDYYPALLDDRQALRKDFSDDGLHPNAAGYAVMAPLAQRAIEQALAH